MNQPYPEGEPERRGPDQGRSRERPRADKDRADKDRAQKDQPEKDAAENGLRQRPARLVSVVHPVSDKQYVSLCGRLG